MANSTFTQKVMEVLLSWIRLVTGWVWNFFQADMGGGAFLDIGCYGAMYSTWFQREDAVSVYANAKNLNTPSCFRKTMLP